MSTPQVIHCPNCATAIDVKHILAAEIEKGFREKYNQLYKQELTKFKEWQAQLEKQQNELIRQQQEHERLVQNKVAEMLNQQRLQLEAELKQKLNNEQQERVRLIEKELQEKSEQVKAMMRTQAEYEKLKREKEELALRLEAEMQKKLNEELERQLQNIRKAESEKYELQIKEMEKKLEDQRKLTEEMKRKQEQGSMQLQGEVMELAIEHWLQQQFPLDTIEEIGKGVRGGDCIQIVNTREFQNCGIIYYESKRAKNFDNDWIEKLKQDVRDRGAHIGVLVTQTYPRGVERMTQIDGIWVCSYEEFKGLCMVLRESIIQLRAATAAQENRGDKMAMLYDFLTGNEFRRQVEAIVEGFSQMQMDLIKEKNAMMKIWKAREKQIEKVLLNTTQMYGAIKGIAGSAIQPIQSLELPEANDNELLLE